MTKNAIHEHLNNHGPSTASELPRKPRGYEPLEHGIRKFNIQPGSGLGQLNNVYYIAGVHTSKSICEKWLSVNEIDCEEDAPGIVRHVDEDAFREAMRDILTDHGSIDWPHITDVEQDGGMGGTCPVCGDQYDNHLPDHLPCDASEGGVCG